MADTPPWPSIDLFDSSESIEDFAARLMADSAAHDHLGKAAIACEEARKAVAEGKHDVAWGFLHEAKNQYVQHAARQRFTAEQTLALDAAISPSFANILRLENKHRDALVHMIYWAATSTPSASLTKRVRPYFNRCKFQSVGLPDLEAFIDSLRPLPDFANIRDTVAGWG